jgi:hypothetical protein
MAEVRVGDEVLSLGRDGAVLYSPVVAFLDKQASSTAAQNAQFLEIQVAGGKAIKLTPEHLIFVARASGSKYASGSLFTSMSRAVAAKQVAVGDYLWLQSADALGVEPALVTSVRAASGQGLYAPLVATGMVVVDGVVASCYSHAQSHDLAHLAMAPLRWFASFFKQNEDANAGIHPFAMFLAKIVPRFIRESAFSLRAMDTLLGKSLVPSLSSGLLFLVGYAATRQRSQVSLSRA